MVEKTISYTYGCAVCIYMYSSYVPYIYMYGMKYVYGTEQLHVNYCRAQNSSWPLTIFRPFSGIGVSKCNLLGQTYYTFSMGKPMIVYENVSTDSYFKL